MPCLLHDFAGVRGPCSVLDDVDTEVLEALDPLHYSPVDMDGGVLGPAFPVVHDHSICLAHVEEEVDVLAPHS